MFKFIEFLRNLDSRESRLLNALRIIKNTFFAVILTLLVAILIVTMLSRVSGKAPSLMGISVYRISSGSMAPTLQVGDVILSRACDPVELKVNDIVTYEGVSGEFEGKTVTHRVVKEPYLDGGDYYIVTRGDNNPADDSPISVDHVLGKMEIKLTVLTALYDFFVTPWGLICIILLIILAFFNEIIIFIKSLLGFKEEKEAALDDIILRYKKQQEEKTVKFTAETEKKERNLRPTRGQRYNARVKPPKGRMTNREKSILSTNPRRRRR